MTQNQNNNLFDFEKPSQEPQPPQPAPGEPTIFSSGAPAFDMPPSQQPVEPPPPAFTPPPSFTPSPPSYTPPATAEAQAPKSNRKIWIIVIVAIVLLCCCCLVIAGVWLWNNGDTLIEQFGSLAPMLLPVFG